MDAVRRIARTVLYEGHVLWPYHRAAPKNRERWTFGRVYPSGHRAEGDASAIQLQALVECEPGAPITLTLGFLQLVERSVVRPDGQPVDTLEVGERRYLAWDEAAEREIVGGEVRAGDRPSVETFTLTPGGTAEVLRVDADGPSAGYLAWTWRGLEGAVTLATEAAGIGLFRVTAELTNTTPWNSSERLLAATFLSTHLVLTSTTGRFVSLQDPPDAWRDAAAACRNVGTWPVLVGEPGARDTLLAAPIVLYDYPQIAPESPGDFFDATEIDEMLVLNVLALTDEERREVMASDPRARELVERCAALTPEDFMRLHGAIRDRRSLDESDVERPKPDGVIVDGVPVRRGSRVRLRPRQGADSLDLAFAGRVGVVASIEQDYDDRVHVAVTLEDDPGRDLGDARMPGHRFFFGPDEVEPLEDDAGAMPARILVAGIGNVFLGDDGFGVEVARRLAQQPRRPGLAVVDYGIRGLDLAYALQDGWDAVILVDAAPRGAAPGTLSVIEPSLEREAGAPSALDAHGMDPVKVLRLAQALGGLPSRVLLVGCEPSPAAAPGGDDLAMELSEPVRAAVDAAVLLVERLADTLGRREAA